MDAVDQLIANLEYVMKDSRISSQPKFGAASGVSPTHIGNILRKDKGASVDVMAKLAHAAGLKAWQLLLPTRFLERGLDAQFNALLEYYLDADPSGRETILRVAQAQSLLRGNPADD